MNISGIGSVSGVDVRDGVGIAVASKTLDAQREQGAAMVNLIRDAGELARASSSTVDSRGRLDVYA